jgi:two-component system cell cycle sensor histidine kinase/response regulator CckA
VTAPAYPEARVLVVDDEAANLRLMERILARAGFTHVVCTTDGRRVAELVEAERPDVILLDLHMPQVDGFSVLRALAAAAGPNDYLPVLVLTADVSTETRNRALQAGARDFVTKPFDPAEVLLRIGNLLDVRSLRAQLQAQYRALEEQLRHAQRLEVLGRLAGGIAHDFNNLLTILRGTTELMLDDAAAGTTLRQDLEENLRALDVAAALTRRLLGFSRPGSLQPRTVELNALVTEMARTLLPLVGARVRVQTRLSRDALPVAAVPGQLEQVLMNLAVNARDAMPSGGTLTITTERMDAREPLPRGSFSVPAGAYAALRVADTGHGMDEATRARLFEPFFTTREEGGGTGLGLSIVYGIVKQAGGWVWVESESGRGAAFEIWLPLDEGTGGGAP